MLTIKNEIKNLRLLFLLLQLQSISFKSKDETAGASKGGFVVVPAPAGWWLAKRPAAVYILQRQEHNSDSLTSKACQINVHR